MTRLRIMTGLMAAALLWGQGAAFAQSRNGPPGGPEEMSLSEITVEGRLLEEKLSAELAEYGAKVHIVDGETLKKRGYSTVSQALSNLVPGLYVRNSARSSRTMRLNGSTSFLVLLDGVRLNNRMFSSGTANPDSIGLHMVDHIEVLYGGEALFYGTNATSGVVNIVTKKPARETSGQISLGYGSYESRDVSAHVSGSLGENNFLVHGHIEDYAGYQTVDTDVYRNNLTDRGPKGLDSDMGRSNMGLKYGREFADGKAALEASFIRNGFKYQTPHPSYLFQDYDGHENIGYLKWGHDVSDRYSYFVKLYFHDWWTEWTGLLPNGTYESHDDEYGYQDWGLHLLNSYRFEQGSEILFGAEFQSYWGKDEVMAQPPSPHETVSAGYFSFRPHFAFWPEWKTSFGVRYNYMEERSSTVWNVTSRMPFLTDMYLAANVGTAFKLPSGNELYQVPSAHGGFQLGNPALKPQDSFYAVVGLGGNWEYGGLDLTGFREKIKNRISAVAGLGPGGEDVYQNIPGDTVVTGYTLSGYLNPLKGFTLSASFTHQKEKARSLDAAGVWQTAAQRTTWPRNFANVSAGWEGSVGDWRSGVNLSNNYTGKQYYRGNLSGEHAYGDYWTTDLSLFVKPAESTTVTLQLSNLFDTDSAYSMGRLRPTPGSPLAGRQEPDGFYYYDSRTAPFAATLSLTYEF